MSTTVANKGIRWSEAEVTILKQEVANSDTKEAAFRKVAELIGKNPATVAQKWSYMQNKDKPKAFKKSKVKLEKVELPKQKLSPGMKLMEMLMGAEISATEITLRPTEMIIKF